MTLPAVLSQRDLVRLAVLLCGSRPGEKYQPPQKGSANIEPSRGDDR
jgi:hypothetical protein